MTVKEIMADFKTQLVHQYGEKEVLQFLFLLFDAWKGWTKTQVLLKKSEALTAEETSRFSHALEELKKNKPVQYITGETWFHGLRILVTPEVLIPRPETEELVALVMHDIKQGMATDLNILDICTGSGCIAVSLKKIFPLSRMTALDISSGALEIARENAAIHDCDVRFMQANILEKTIPESSSLYNIIISNPPYVTESEKSMMEKNVLDYEPAIALFVPDGDPLLFYKAIMDFALVHLEKPGKLYVEINERYAVEIEQMLLSKGFHHVEIIQDIHQRSRFAKSEFSE
jgi:release factor glutamine methyltransferase